MDSGHSGHCASKEDEKNGHQNDEARESGVVNGSIGPVKELVNEKTRAGAGGKEGGVTSQINLVPEEEEGMIHKLMNKFSLKRKILLYTQFSSGRDTYIIILITVIITIYK